MVSIKANGSESTGLKKRALVSHSTKARMISELTSDQADYCTVMMLVTLALPPGLLAERTTE